MAAPQKFSYEFSASGTPEEAEARLEGAISARLRSGAVEGGLGSDTHRQMRLATRTPVLPSYRPRLAVPMRFSITLWLGRLIIGENVNVTFTADRPDGEHA